MYKKGVFKGKSLEEIEKIVKTEGFNPIKITDGPGFVYSPHHHPQTKLLALLSGSMLAKVGNEEFELNQGDKLIIPGNVTHSAVVGAQGCVFFWSEKMV